MDKITVGVVAPQMTCGLRDLLYDSEKSRMPDGAGVVTSVNALVRGLTKLGHHVLVFSYDHMIENEIEYHGEHIDIYIIPRRFLKRRKIKGDGVFSRAYMGKKLSEKIGEHIDEIDVLHPQWTYDCADACISFIDKVPVFCTVRDWCPYIMSLHNGFRHWISCHISYTVFKRVMSYDKIHFIANSYYTEERLKNYGINLQYPILPNPIESEFVIDRQRDYPQKYVFISIAQSLSDERKNIRNLLLAFSELQKNNKDCELLLVGGCSDQFIAKCEADGLLHNVNFVGKCDRSEIRKILDQSSVLIHPSLEETFGNILLEGMARKLPVIGGEDAGAVPLVLGKGEYGCLCDVRDPHSICKAMKKIMEDEKYRQSLIDKSFEYLKNNYLDYKVAQMHVDCYRDALTKFKPDR